MGHHEVDKGSERMCPVAGAQFGVAHFKEDNRLTGVCAKRIK